MPHGLRPIAFLDLDGPILDVASRHYRVYRDAVTQLGGRPVSSADFWSAKRRKVPDRDILARTGLAAAADSYHALKLEFIEAPSYLADDRLQAATPATLERIGCRYHLVLVTLRRSPSALRQQLATLGLISYFDHVLSAPADSGSGWKTKLALVRDAGFAAGAGDFFAGDTETDIKAGRALGITTVAVCNGIRDEDLLRAEQPDWIISSLADLPFIRSTHEGTIR